MDIPTIEYLIIIEKKTSQALFALCDSLEAFEKFLQTDQTIHIDSPQKIREASTSSLLNFQAEMSQIKDKKQRFFYLQISANNIESVENLVALARAIKSIVIKGGGQIETLWDDVSLYFSHKAYPYIHRIENLMRKLITYFMITTVGKEWVTTASPEAIRKQINNKQKQYIDALFQVDFIHLGDFLFKAYATRNINELFNLIDEQEELTEISTDDILEFKAQSNWDRYFSDFVECEAAYLKKRWSQLYELRCEVAHNKLFGKSDFQNVVRLVEEIEPFLHKALDAANKVEVSSEDKEQIAESVASSISSLYGDFIETWREFEVQLKQVANKSIKDDLPSNHSIRRIASQLNNEGIIADENFVEIQKLFEMRNSIVHGASIELSENDINQGMERLKLILESLPSTSPPVSFHADCIRRLEAHLDTTFSKKSRTTYINKQLNMTLACTVSKLHERQPRPYYWFGFHPRQLDFLKNGSISYAAFGCGSANTIILIPTEKLLEYIQDCNVTESPRYYWHIQFHVIDGNLFLHQKNGDHKDMSEHTI